MAQFFRQQRAEFDAPLAQRFMADLYAALVQQLLDIPIAQWEAVVEPDGVLDDGHWKTVAVGLEVGHGGSG